VLRGTPFVCFWGGVPNGRSRMRSLSPRGPRTQRSPKGTEAVSLSSLRTVESQRQRLEQSRLAQPVLNRFVAPNKKTSTIKAEAYHSGYEVAGTTSSGALQAASATGAGHADSGTHVGWRARGFQ
jgi:hypothetical protein